MQLDPADYAVISQGLIAAAREMGTKLVRSAYSTIVREARDASAALLDAQGDIVAQAELIPLQLGSMRATFRACADLYDLAELTEDDFFVNNSPFEGGQHLPDVFIFSPIFVDGDLIGFSASVAHHLDLGGGAPGLNAGASDIYQEGLIIPPSKYSYGRDWNGGTFERLVAANIRVPELTIGDFNAQFAANAIGAARITQLCRKYGIDTVRAAMAELQDYAERRVRTAIDAIPDGVYEGEDRIDDDGITDDPLVVKVRMEVKGDAIALDFAGSSPQVSRNLNSPLSSSEAAAVSAIKAALTSPDIPFNGGAERPVSIAMPYGSILNPKPPAPVRARLEACYRVFNAVMKALAQATPERAIACGFDTTTSLSLSYLGEQGYKVYIEIFGGGYGAGAESDGCDAVDSPLSNCSNSPVEQLDLSYDYFRVAEYALQPDSGGAGRHRGGLGFVRRYEILKDGVVFATYSDRFRFPAEGLFGGKDGSCGRCEVLRDGAVVPIRSKAGMTLNKGDVLSMHLGGGAGYGEPAERAPALVLRDVRQGYLSREAAERDYGPQSLQAAAE